MDLLSALAWQTYERQTADENHWGDLKWKNADIVEKGMDVVILPFTTPETVAFLGYQKSKIAGRILGIMLVIAGIWFEFL